MSQFTAFDEFGLFSFSSTPSPAETAYQALKSQYAPAFDLSVGTYAEAKVFATAMAIGRLRATVTRTSNQRSPSLVVDKLPSMERDFGVIPSPTATIPQRQAVLAARNLLMRGSRQEAIETELRAVLGSDLITVRIQSAATANEPEAMANMDHPPKFATLLDPVAFTSVATTVRYSVVNGSEDLRTGDIVCVEPEVDGIGEHVRVTSATLIGTTRYFTATFILPHSVDAMILTHGIRFESTRRDVSVVIRSTAIGNLETQRLIHDVMARHSRSVTRWRIVETANGSTVGPFIVGTSHVGSVPIGPAAVAI